MCGIAGIVTRRPRADLGRRLGLLADALHHRGPDGRGFASVDDGQFVFSQCSNRIAGGRFGLAQTRLAIVDPSDAAAQPMIRDNSTKALSFNGEIYNYVEIHRTLGEIKGKLSYGDSEALFGLLLDHGLPGLDKTIGMFAFAYADLSSGKLILARDPFGIKPLYYFSMYDQFCFASEIPALLRVFPNTPSVNPDSLLTFLRHAITDHGSGTFVSGINSLLPGHAICVDLDNPASIQVFPWWAPRKEARDIFNRLDAAEALRELLQDSIRLHLRADVPIATTLSGGVDSSTLSGFIRNEIGLGGSIAGFTYRADDTALDESCFARQVAQMFGIQHFAVDATAEELLAQWDLLLMRQGEPITTSSVFAQARVFSEVAANGYKVAIDGQGADELLGGYEVFRAARAAELVRAARLPSAMRILSFDNYRQLPGTFARLLPSEFNDLARRLTGAGAVPPWLDATWFKRWLGRVPTQPAMRPTLVDEVEDSITRTSLPMLLRFADRNAMAASVENRVPFLTPRIASFARRLAPELLIDSDGWTKPVLRDAIKDLVPASVLQRRDKIGFQTPENRWANQYRPFAARLASHLASPLPEPFRVGREKLMRSLKKGHVSGPVWRVVSTLAWAEAFDVEFPS